jgi:metal-sulfur cluster biosynthetic enzyme
MMGELIVKEIIERLRRVAYPGARGDVVSWGLIKEIGVDGRTLTICFTPNTQDSDKIERIEKGINAALAGLPHFDEIAVKRAKSLTLDAQYDIHGATKAQSDLLKQAPYNGNVSVLQWDGALREAAAEAGEEVIKLGDREIGVWWQVHPMGLVYASMQAIFDDWSNQEGLPAIHQVGASDEVHLVYDHDRNAVVAIYGTVPDFKPFLAAFCHAYLQAQRPNA